MIPKNNFTTETSDNPESVIIGLGNESSLTVQKSLPLLSLWQSDMTLAEFKILDLYLSRIDSHKPEKRTVTFNKSELEKMLQVQKINNTDLRARLTRMQKNIVNLPTQNGKSKDGEFDQIILFSRAALKKGEDGQWTVTLACSQEAMQYIFNIENIGYLRYKLRCVTSLSSRYAYILFMYLESNRNYRSSWTTPLEELKNMLKCDKDPLYTTYKRFNERILKKAYAEILERTPCRFSYEPVKKGRSVVAIRFTLMDIGSIEDQNSQACLESVKPAAAQTDDADNMPLYPKRQVKEELWTSPLESFNFTEEQLLELFAVLATIPDSKLPQGTSFATDDIEIRRYHYIDQKAAEINERKNHGAIGNPFRYLLKMLKTDAADA